MPTRWKSEEHASRARTQLETPAHPFPWSKPAAAYAADGMRSRASVGAHVNDITLAQMGRGGGGRHYPS